MDIDSTCPFCGRPGVVVSRHRTSEGEVVYRRCACGRLHVRRGAELVLRSRGGVRCVR